MSLLQEWITGTDPKKMQEQVNEFGKTHSVNFSQLSTCPTGDGRIHYTMVLFWTPKVGL
jgi:hypothetical protein